MGKILPPEPKWEEWEELECLPSWHNQLMMPIDSSQQFMQKRPETVVPRQWYGYLELQSLPTAACMSAVASIIAA